MTEMELNGANCESGRLHGIKHAENRGLGTTARAHWKSLQHRLRFWQFGKRTQRKA